MVIIMPAGAGRPILYSFCTSSCSWRVRLALNLKEIAYETKPVSLVKGKGEQHSDEFKKINPMRQIPALHIDGVTLIESLSIIDYLEDTRKQKPLMPEEFIQRAKVRELSQIIVSAIQPYQNLIVLNQLPKDKQIDWARHWITRGFTAVEQLLSFTSGKYCVGNEITVADCCLVPQVFHAKHRFKMDLKYFPNILRIDHELENHPAFEAAHAYNQTDFPPRKT